MSYSVSRLTLYALLSSLEDDLRRLIEINLSHLPNAKLLTDDLFAKVGERCIKDIGLSIDNLSTKDVILYLDFGDLFQVLNSHRKDLSQELSRFIKDNTPKLEKLIPVRNRVAHSRPLNTDDWGVLFETVESFIDKQKELLINLSNTLERLKQDPSFVLELKIPPPYIDGNTIHHNLPIPDFDESGFLGRKEQVDRLIKLCSGPYPVITIVGEGGIGKTALALKVAYEITELKNQKFDAVVWVSSKTTQLTPQEIVRIEGSIRDSLGMFQYVAQQLGGSILENPFLEILEYLREFKILLIIDNLETVLDEKIRFFLEQLPEGSKVLITSRIGLGAFEYPVKLDEMDSNDSVRLLRALAKVRGVNSLYKLESDTIKNYCEKMNNNPGYIKWFVSAIQSGSRPEDVFAKSDLFLDFCMSNVYHFLSENARHLLKVMFVISNRHNQAELAFLSGLEVVVLQRAIHEALRTNMVIMSSEPSGGSFESRYELSDLARQYLAKHHPVNSIDLDSIIKKNKQLIAAQEQISNEKSLDPYSFNNIHIRTKSDLVVAKYLLDALKFAKQGNFDKANSLIFEAKSLSPEYYEVHRVEAIIRTQEGNVSGAQLAYEAVIELEPNSAPVRKWYGDFLLKYYGSADAALTQYEEAARIDPGSNEIQVVLARAKIYLKRFDDAEKILLIQIESRNMLRQTLRKTFDLSLQCFYRWGEMLMENNVPLSVEKFEIMRQFYEKCPRDLIDSQMIETLEKAAHLLSYIAQGSYAPEIMDKSSKLSQWLLDESSTAMDSLASRTQGKIHSLLQGYGFVRMRNGKSIFFHRSDLDFDKWEDIWVGDTVTFLIGVDSNHPEHRPRAYNIRLKAPKN